MFIIFFILALVILEIIIGFFFSIIAQVFYKKEKIDFKSLLKGIAERLFLTVFIYNGLPGAITFFSALKLATRLKHNEDSPDVQKFNDYYLMGNLASATMALFYVYILNNKTNIEAFLSILFNR